MKGTVRTAGDGLQSRDVPFQMTRAEFNALWNGLNERSISNYAITNASQEFDSSRNYVVTKGAGPVENSKTYVVPKSQAPRSLIDWVSRFRSATGG